MTIFLTPSFRHFVQLKPLILVLAVCILPLTQGSVISEEIYNGNNSTKGQFPYVALLVNLSENKTSSFCGGSLISVNHILTAAHCSYRMTQTTAYLGLTNSQDGNGAIYQIIPSNNMNIHEKYNPSTLENDISILKLVDTVILTSLIQTISLPKSSWSSADSFDNYKVVTVGWGQTKNDEVGVHQMQQNRVVNKMAQTDCVNYYATVLPINEGMICTDKTIYAGPCKGDSGGPLTVKLNTGLYQIGCVSWGLGPCSSTNPVVHTNIANYLPWINSITGIPIN